MKHIYTILFVLSLSTVTNTFAQTNPTIPSPTAKKVKDNNPNKDNWNKARMEMDLNKDGRVDEAEAKAYRDKLTQAAVNRVALLQANKPLTQKDVAGDPALRNNFQLLDKNHDGKLTPDELTKPKAKKEPPKTNATGQTSSKTPVWKKKSQ